MKLISYILFSMVLAVCSASFAKVQDLKTALAFAKNEDLGKLLAQVTLVPTKEKQKGKMLFKVTKIEKGSTWERLGWKVGDLVLADPTP